MARRAERRKPDERQQDGVESGDDGGPGDARVFARKCDIDRAEASLIAAAGMSREARR